MFRHPVVLMLVGALLSSYLIPSFTRKWQDHQKALEVRSDLASQIAGAATSAIMRSETLHAEGKLARPDHDTWLTWRIRSAAVEARLRAYLSNGEHARDWSGFMQAVDAFHLVSMKRSEDPTALDCVHTLLLGTSPAARQVERAARTEARGAIPRLRRPKRIQCLSDLPIRWGVRTYADPFEYKYYLVMDELAARMTELVDRILDSDVTAF